MADFNNAQMQQLLQWCRLIQYADDPNLLESFSDIENEKAVWKLIQKKAEEAI